MSPVVHRFDWPDRFVVGTVGVPGSRTFFLQARTAEDLISVKVEKEQTAALAQRIDEVLDDLMDTDGNPFSIPAGTAPELEDIDPLDEPVDEQFRVGVMSLGWDAATAQVIIEAFPLVEADPDQLTIEEIEAIEPEEVLIVRIPVGTARAFSKRTRDIVAAGRPVCTLCGEPMDAEHVCDLPDGFR